MRAHDERLDELIAKHFLPRRRDQRGAAGERVRHLQRRHGAVKGHALTHERAEPGFHRRLVFGRRFGLVAKDPQPHVGKSPLHLGERGGEEVEPLARAGAADEHEEPRLFLPANLRQPCVEGIRNAVQREVRKLAVQRVGDVGAFRDDMPGAPQRRALGHFHDALARKPPRRDHRIDQKKKPLRRDHARPPRAQRGERVAVLGAVGVNQVGPQRQRAGGHAPGVEVKKRGRAEAIRRGEKMHGDAIDDRVAVPRRARNLHDQFRLNARVRALGDGQIQHPAAGMTPHFPIVRMLFRDGQIAQVDDFHGGVFLM